MKLACFDTTTNSRIEKDIRCIKRTKYLAIHKDIDYSIEGEYAITHIPTGFKVLLCADLYSAKIILNELEKGDWDFKTPDDPKRLALKPLMLDIFKRYRIGRLCQVIF